MTDRQQEAIAESLNEYGQVLPIIVRPHPEIEGEYQIIDGEHRFNISKQSICCNIIDANDVTAKKLTIVMNETRGEADKIELASLLAELSKETDDLLTALPYSQDELNELVKLADVDWDQFNNEFSPDEESLDEGFQDSDENKLSIILSSEGMDLLSQCKDLLSQEKDLDKDTGKAWGQVVEVIAMEYLAIP